MTTDMMEPCGFATSPQIELIAAALAKAQAAFVGIGKEHTAEIRSAKGNYSYSYASLPDVIAATRPALNSQGISVLQPIVPYGAGPAIHSVLIHESGQWISNTCPFEMPAGNAQTQASAVTYWRRYSLQALLCTAADDDDGAGASAAPRAVARPSLAPNREPSDLGWVHNAAGAPSQARPSATTNGEPIPSPANGHTNGTATATPSGPPATGRDFYNFCKAKPRLFAFLDGWAKDHGFPARIVDWDEHQVALGYAEARRKLNRSRPPHID